MSQLIREADGLNCDNSLFYCDLKWYVSRLQKITVTTIKLRVQHLGTHAFAFCYQQARRNSFPERLSDCASAITRV